MPRFSVEDRVREAYVRMAQQASYRPEAAEFARQEDDLTDEAASYARRFLTEEQTTDFHIGISDYTTNRALVYTIEAARLLCCGASGDNHALKLLEMAIEEVRVQARPELPPVLRGAKLG